jgi:hypothetical protein
MKALRPACLLFALLAGCATPRPPAYEPLVARLYLEAKPGETGVPLRLPVSEVSITVAPKPVFVEYDLRDAAVARVDLGQCLLLRFSPAAARDLYRLTAANPGRRLVLLLNEQPAGVHRIESAVADGTLLVFVERPDAELPALAERLRRTSTDIAAAAARPR